MGKEFQKAMVVLGVILFFVIGFLAGRDMAPETLKVATLGYQHKQLSIDRLPECKDLNWTEKNICVYSKAMEEKNADYCQLISWRAIKITCTAVLSRDASLCSEIPITSASGAELVKLCNSEVGLVNKTCGQGGN